MSDRDQSVRLAQRIRIVRGATVLAPVAATELAVYVGDQRRELVKLNCYDWQPAWRIAAEGFETWFLWRDRVLLRSIGSGLVRAIDASGVPLWTVRGRTPWIRWGDRLLQPEPDFETLDLESGEVARVLDLPAGITGAWPLSGGRFLLGVARDGQWLQVFDTTARRVLWERDLVADAKRLYGVSGTFLGVGAGNGRWGVTGIGKNLLGVDLDDGRICWHVPLWVDRYLPMQRHGRVYAWAYEGWYVARFVALDAATGEVIYEIPLAQHGGGFAESHEPWPPAVSSNHIVFTTNRGLIAMFRFADGELVWSHQYKADLYAPVIAGGRLFVTSGDGHLLVFEGEPGVFSEDSVSR